MNSGVAGLDLPSGLKGYSGMGQIIPGVKAETTQLVVYGALALVGVSIVIYVLTRPSKAGGGGNAVAK